eukprot:4262956-Pleurochrysis_carterae.AAC.4
MIRQATVRKGAEPRLALRVAILRVLALANHQPPRRPALGRHAGVQVRCKSARPLQGSGAQ